MKNRRQFLFDCSTLTVAAGLLPSALMAAAAAKMPACAADFAAFAAQQGTVFTVSSPATSPVRLKLVAAKTNPSTHPLAHLAPDARNEKFSLLFRSTGPLALTQNTYAFEHPALGRLDIFIVPVQVRGSAHSHYEAIFNCPPTETSV